ncbi:minor capsid protein [Bacillus toyonensis]|uniref:minor capsid protein n=1 Tax=Bacillus toyonensis TaxID=155322 RepID=UPI000BF56B0A|nr:minor capsid protein [Bacillus toyonensis]PFY36880.1 hypothetical protein COL55_28390 [Bacillus toyonensis]PFY43859.1 hypothetical protein COL54_12520 [Bacillus toyonensis]PFY73566.1 hypothetical protein COL62_24315 [Bacillus toyonensis]PHA42888.1 hypothetical protein COE68_18010 [Bacillus toyonensis]PHG01199.1 hypothetical protein COI63_25335 [Bacillus toyonensis]
MANNPSLEEIKQLNRKSTEYWLKRTSEIANNVWKSEDEIQKELTDIYEDAMEQVAKEVESFYTKYSTKHGMTLEEARKKVTATDLADFDKKIRRLAAKSRNKNITQQEIEQFELLRAKYTVTRLDLLMNEIDLALIRAYGEQQITMEEHLKQVAAETYYETSGLVANFVRLPEEELIQIITVPWSGEEFSDTLWKNKTLLVFNLRKTITSGLIRGASVQQMARELRKTVGNSKYASERIIRTETGYVMNETTAKSYIDNGMEQYEFMANVDSRTSKVCKRLNKKVYNVSERQIGVNFPPMHPNCRSFIVPVIE